MIDPRPWDPPEYWDPPEPELIPVPIWRIEAPDGSEDYATPAELPTVLALYANEPVFTAALEFTDPY